jgi:hypothetical protein
MSMNDFLAQAYGNSATTEDQEKVAAAVAFTKVASESGIDLTQYTDEQVTDLYNTWLAKEAAEGEHGHKGHKHGHKHGHKGHGEKEVQAKVAAAQAEFATTKEAQAKFVEADAMGRIMAHAFVQESRFIGEKIAAAAAAETSKEASNLVRVSDAGKWMKRPGLADKAKALLKHNKGKAAVGAGAAAAATGGAAAAAAHHGDKGKKKKASAQDEVAAELALHKVAEAGGDPEDAGNKLDALFTLGLPADEESKVASAENFEQGMHIRALELLEMVGYPVNWG